MANKFSEAKIRLNCAKKIRASCGHIRRGGGRRFKSLLPHHPVRQFSDLSENRSKSARVRAICDHAWTRRTPSAARIRRIQQNLSGRDLARSMDHRRKFACSWNPANRPDEGRRVRRTPWLRPEDHVYDATRESSLGFKPQPLRLRFIVCFVHLPTLTVFEVKRSGLEVMKVSDQRRRAEGPA